MMAPSGHIISPFVAMPLYTIDPHLPYVMSTCCMLFATLVIISSKRLRRAGRFLHSPRESENERE